MHKIHKDFHKDFHKEVFEMSGVVYGTRFQ